MLNENAYIEPKAVEVALKGCCPRCGEGRLYDGILTPATKCMACQLDYSFIDSGDGPAVFVILIVGFIVTAMALALQTSVNPPVWVQVVVWTPVIIVASVWGLRFAKSIMISLQFQTKAKEGQLGEGHD